MTDRGETNVPKATLIYREQRGNVLRQYRADEDDFETCVESLRKRMTEERRQEREPVSPPVIGEAS